MATNFSGSVETARLMLPWVGIWPQIEFMANRCGQFQKYPMIFFLDLVSRNYFELWLQLTRQKRIWTAPLPPSVNYRASKFFLLTQKFFAKSRHETGGLSKNRSGAFPENPQYRVTSIDENLVGAADVARTAPSASFYYFQHPLKIFKCDYMQKFNCLIARLS